MEGQNKFKRDAEHRVNKALWNLQLISDLASNPKLYYDKNQVDKIIGALQGKVLEVKLEFKSGLERIKKGNEPFKF